MPDMLLPAAIFLLLAPADTSALAICFGVVSETDWTVTIPLQLLYPLFNLQLSELGAGIAVMISWRITVERTPRLLVLWGSQKLLRSLESHF